MSTQEGSLALVGSGEYLPQMADLEKLLLEDGISKGKRPVYIQLPTAAGRENKERLKYWERLGKSQADALGVEQIFLPIYDRESAKNPQLVKLIEDGALIYISGGDPHYLAETLIDTPVWSAIEGNWQTGGSLAGCSAGAMVLSSQVPNFGFFKKDSTQGLGLTPQLRVIPHYNKFFKWIPDSAARGLTQVPDGSILLGIDELTALVKRGGEDSWFVHGEAKVHLLKGLPARQLSHSERIIIPNHG